MKLTSDLTTQQNTHGIVAAVRRPERHSKQNSKFDICDVRPPVKQSQLRQTT